MGYTTDFNGQLSLSKPLTEEQFKYINDFNSSRRMKRDVNKLMELYKGKGGFPGKTVKKNTPNQIYGVDGAFFVNATNMGQDRDESIIDYNIPPGQSLMLKSWDRRTREKIESGKCQPSLWCQWNVTGEGNEQVLEWDGGEKFYEYIDWVKYLITNFFKPWNVKLNGEITWVGEESTDLGKIVVKDNLVEVYNGNVTYTKS